MTLNPFRWRRERDTGLQQALAFQAYCAELERIRLMNEALDRSLGLRRARRQARSVAAFRGAETKRTNAAAERQEARG